MSAVRWPTASGSAVKLEQQLRSSSVSAVRRPISRAANTEHVLEAHLVIEFCRRPQRCGAGSGTPTVAYGGKIADASQRIEIHLREGLRELIDKYTERIVVELLLAP